uniref:ShTK domain protein n=1 Tax=Angiostrongylus cantonensis TaxID=6313 RepID=A0A158P7W9_ANGCA
LIFFFLFLLSCVDRVNPRTGVSDCPRVSALCRNPVYDAVMTRQCPKTCGRCGITNSTATTPAVCQDMINPATGISDCPARASLCRNPNYVDLMRVQCGKTCQYC